MKKILLIALLVPFYGLSEGFTQNSAELKIATKPLLEAREGFRLEGVETTKDEFSKAISAANLETYRLKSKEVVLKFEEGFDCILVPAETLKKQGISINTQLYNTEYPDNYKLPLFSILKDGTLKATYESISK
jgi:hypothetical protein